MRIPSSNLTQSERAFLRDDFWMQRARLALWIIAGLAVFTVWGVASTAWFVHKADTVPGRVVAKFEHPRRGATEQPEFTYVVKGRTYRARADVGDPAINIGDRVEVLVDPDAPDDARLATGQSVWKSPLLVAAITVVLALFILCSRLLVRTIALRHFRRVLSEPPESASR